MKDGLSWFKMVPADFLTDARVEVMDMDAFGMYCYLLFRGWMDGGIPKSLDEISRYAKLRGIRKPKLEKMWEQVKPCWNLSENGQRLVNKRQEFDRRVAVEIQM